MIGIYVRLSTDMLIDPKLLPISADARWTWLRGLLFAKAQLTDGFVPDAALPVVTLGAASADRAVAELVAVGLWQRCDDGHTVGAEKWAKYQQTSEQIETRRRQWSEGQRQRRQRSVNVDSTLTQRDVNASESESESESEKKKKKELPPPPLAKPAAAPSPEILGASAPRVDLADRQEVDPTPALEPGPPPVPVRPFGSRAEKQTAKRQQARESWLTPYLAAWTAAYEGDLRPGRAAKALAPARAKLGDDELLRRWGRYLAGTEPRFASPEDFGAKLGRWVEPPPDPFAMPTHAPLLPEPPATGPIRETDHPVVYGLATMWRSNPRPYVGDQLRKLGLDPDDVAARLEPLAMGAANA